MSLALPTRRGLLASTPAGVLSGFALDMDFGGNRAFCQGAASNWDAILTGTGGVSSNGMAFALKADGSALAFAANARRMTDIGFAIHEARSTIVPKSRRLDDTGVWTISNLTTSAAVGLDGVAGSCTRLTATANNATVLGPTTSIASAAMRFSPWFRRVAGTGTISVTLDGGTTWQAITAPTGVLTRFPYGQTVANPRLGIKIGSSGDVIDVDFAGGETVSGGAAFDTDPIESLSAAATRAADVWQLQGAALAIALQSTISVVTRSLKGPTTQNIFAVSDGTLNNRKNLFINGTQTGTAVARTQVFGAATDITLPASIVVGAPATLSAVFAASDQAATVQGGSPGTSSSGLPTVTSAYIGNRGDAAGGFLNTYATRIAIATSRIPNGRLQGLLN